MWWAEAQHWRTRSLVEPCRSWPGLGRVRPAALLHVAQVAQIFGDADRCLAASTCLHRIRTSFVPEPSSAKPTYSRAGRALKGGAAAPMPPRSALSPPHPRTFARRPRARGRRAQGAHVVEERLHLGHAAGQPEPRVASRRGDGGATSPRGRRAPLRGPRHGPRDPARNGAQRVWAGIFSRVPRPARGGRARCHCGLVPTEPTPNLWFAAAPHASPAEAPVLA